MVRKFLAICALLASSTLVFANSAPYIATDIGITNNTSNGNGGSFRGGILSIAAGFGGNIDQSIYMGGELFGNVFTTTLDNNPGTVSLRTTMGYGLSFIPGLLISDHTMVYLRAGLVRMRFSNIGKVILGSQYGLGIQTGLTQNWDLRGEYHYTSYQSAGGVSPYADQVEIGLVYKFE